MRRHLDEWCHGWTGKDRDTLRAHLTAGLGEWLPPQAVPTISALASSAFYARMGPDCGRDGTRFGPPSEAQHYDVLLRRFGATSYVPREPRALTRPTTRHDRVLDSARCEA